MLIKHADQGTSTCCTYVVQHQDRSMLEYSHLFGCDGVVVLSCVLT
jgi:hypothetical protein